MIRSHLIAVLIGFLIGCMLTFNACVRDCDPVIVEKVVVDTAVVILPGEKSTVHVPKLVKETVIKNTTDTLIQFLPSGADEYEDEDVYYSIKRDYTDTVRFKEGRVIVNNSVYKNQMFSQQVFLDSVKQMIITRKETVVQPPKGGLYIGFGGSYAPKDSSVGLSASLLWKTKKDRMYQVGANLNTKGIITYGVGILYPLKK